MMCSATSTSFPDLVLGGNMKFFGERLCSLTSWQWLLTLAWPISKGSFRSDKQSLHRVAKPFYYIFCFNVIFTATKQDFTRKASKDATTKLKDGVPDQKKCVLIIPFWHPTLLTSNIVLIDRPHHAWSEATTALWRWAHPFVRLHLPVALAPGSHGQDISRWCDFKTWHLMGRGVSWMAIFLGCWDRKIMFDDND